MAAPEEDVHDGVDVAALLAEMDGDDAGGGGGGRGGGGGGGGGGAGAAAAAATAAVAAWERDALDSPAGAGAVPGGILGAAGAGEPAWTPHRQLLAAWLSERAAPELLPYEGELVEQLGHAVAEQIRLVQNSNADDTVNAFLGNLYFIEVERIKYIIRGYLRTRLTKIEATPHAILTDDLQLSRLSPQEREHLDGFVELMDQHMLAGGLAQFPPVFHALRDPRYIPAPRLSSYVFCRVRESVGPYQLNASAADVEDLVKGNVYAVRYDRIAELVLTKKLDLL